MKFYNREKELAFFDKIEKTSNRSAQMTFVVGRRRIGKNSEPICFSGNTIDCSEALTLLNTIYDLLNWINPELVKFFDNLDNVRNKINQLNQI